MAMKILEKRSALMRGNSITIPSWKCNLSPDMTYFNDGCDIYIIIIII
jgi:hypothetical protein